MYRESCYMLVRVMALLTARISTPSLCLSVEQTIKVCASCADSNLTPSAKTAEQSQLPRLHELGASA